MDSISDLHINCVSAPADTWPPADDLRPSPFVFGDYKDPAEQRSLAAFEVLMRRPSNYFSLSPARQWEEDDALGALDLCCDPKFVTPEMMIRWNLHFGVQQ